MSTKTRRQKERDRREQEIVEAAQKVFFEKGYQAATMSDIAKAAELSKGTLYLYFESKSNLFTRLLEGIQKHASQRVLKIVESEKKPLEQLVRIACVYGDFFEQNAGHAKVLASLMTSSNTEVFYSIYSPEMMEASERENQMVSSVVEKGIQEGVLRPDLCPAQVSSQLWLGLMGVSLLEITGGDPFYAEHCTPQYVPSSRSFLETIVRGLSTVPETVSSIFHDVSTEGRAEHE